MALYTLVCSCMTFCCLVWFCWVSQNIPKLENKISLAPMSVQYHSALEKYKILQYRAHIYIAQGLSKGPGPIHKSKIKCSKVPLVGALNLCLKMPEKMQKTRNESDHPEMRKHKKKW